MIAVESISVSRQNRVVVTDFSLEIARGKIIALVGPNGSGKSTILQALSGDLKTNSGGIFYDGKAIESMPINELAEQRSVSQQHQRFTLAYSVYDILEMVAGQYGNLESITEAVLALNIEPLLSRKITSLSGGEQQRVSIAMALSRPTPYLLLDEPFAAQDLESEKRISTHLQFLAKRGVGILIVAHMLERDLAWCDTIKRLEMSQS